MVKLASRTFGIALVGMGLCACPAWADNILEQMQNEVATVAGRARSCVVSIEDARAVVVGYNNSALEKADLQNQIAHLQIDRKAAQTLAAQEEERYRAGLTTALDVEKPRRELARLDARLTYLQQTLANFGREDMTAQHKRELDARIVELLGDQKFNAEQIKFLQQQFNAGVVTVEGLQAAQQEAAHIQLELTAAQAQRQAWGQKAPESVIFTWDNSRANTPKSGSGFSVGNGYIVTTADVAQGMSSPIVTSDDGRRIRAILVAVDGERNVGLVRLASNVTLPGLTLGDSDRVRPGHFAISIGNQAGQYNSVALGLISGIRLQGLYSGAHFYPVLMQVDGAGGAGTSGAPVMNARGEVIGMIAAALALDPVPSASSGYVDTSLQTLNGTIAPFAPLNGLAPVGRQSSAVGNSQSSAGRVTGRGGSAAQTPSDIQGGANSVSRYLENRIQTGASSAQRATENLNTFFIPNRSMNAPRPLAASAGTGFAIPINAMKDVIEELKAGRNIVHVWLGVILEDVDNAREENGTVRLNSQVRIRSVYANSPAAKVGMQPGDVFVNLNGKPVNTASEVRAAIFPEKAGHKVAVVVQRGAKSLTLNLTMESQPTQRPMLLPANPAPAGSRKSPASP